MVSLREDRGLNEQKRLVLRRDGATGKEEQEAGEDEDGGEKVAERAWIEEAAEARQGLEWSISAPHGARIGTRKVRERQRRERRRHVSSRGERKPWLSRDPSRRRQFERVRFVHVATSRSVCRLLYSSRSDGHSRPLALDGRDGISAAIY